MNKDHLNRRNSKMPWGKFKGKFIKELPDWYVEWASLSYDQAGMRIWFKEELDYRNRYEKKNLTAKYIPKK